MLFGLLGLHALAGVVVLVAGRRLGRWAVCMGGVPPALTMSWVALRAGDVMAGGTIDARANWVTGLGLALDLRLDGFALLMTILVSGIGTLIFVYAFSYFGASEQVGGASGLLTLFAGSMLGVVLADNLLVLYLCWELTSVTSYLLIGIDDAEADARSAALHALLVTGFGGLAMLGGFVVIGHEAGTHRISELLADPPTSRATSVALVFVLLGAFTKSAQYPFHSWLPGAMVAPTPISAYLHSAAMVKAGVYLVARLAPAFASVGVFRPLVVTAGLTTMVAGALRALRPFDLKQVLAFGTISQLGFMMVLLGIGRPEASAAGSALLLAHGLFKATLFMVVGIVEHESRTRDIRTLPILGPAWAPLRTVALLSAASMAAVPPLAGFIAKEEAYAALLHGGSSDRLVLGGIVVGSMLTVAYSLRFVVALARPDHLIDRRGRRAVLRTGPASLFMLPAAVLTAGTVALGVTPALWSNVVDHAARALDARSGAHLELWHGLTAPLVLSMLTLTGGGLLFWARGPVEVLQGRLAPRMTGADAYDDIVRRVLRLAAGVTKVLQSGSLPIYAAVILAIAATAPTIGMVSGEWWPGWPDVVGRPVHVPVAGLLITGALGAAVTTRRFTAALLLGVVGYGMAIFFVAQGAPDLALTQFAVETLSVVVFLLVMRRLPDRFERRTPAIGRPYRVGVSTAVGMFVVLMAVATAGSRTEPPVSRAMSERALPEGNGNNVVNVILVDMRGMDTLGEVTVLVGAGIGIVALSRAGQRPRHADVRRRTGGATSARPRPSLIFDTTVRLVFDAALVLSIYLLFAGHNQPGGGFVGGLVAGAAISLRFIAGGYETVRSLVPVRPWTFLAVGLGTAAASALAPIVEGRAPLDQRAFEWDVVGLGHVKATTAMVFDSAVYLIVIGLVLMVIEGLGEDWRGAAEPAGRGEP